MKMIMNHLEFAASESAALEDTKWDQWIDRLEKRVGHDLDGDQDEDGYSLDDCVEMFEAGKTVSEAFQSIAWRKRGLHKSA